MNATHSPDDRKTKLSILHPHGDQPILTSGAEVDSARGAVVLVHGRGATGASILTLAAELPHPDLAYVAPQAAGGSWYPLSFMAERDKNEPALTSALLRLSETVSLLETAGIPSEQIMLLGFSQGACLSLEYALRRAVGSEESGADHDAESNPAALGAVVALTGGLIGPAETRWDDLGSPNVFEGTPIFIGTSDVDPHVPLARAEESAGVLKRLGAEVELKVYPGFGHSVNADELAHARRLLDRMMG